MEFHTIFIIVFSVFLLYFYYQNQNSEVKYVISTFDNRRYLVRHREDEIAAANLLAKIRANLVSLCAHMEAKNDNNSDVARMVKRFDPDNITESGKNTKYTSYSVNKGEKVVLCIRSRNDAEVLIDENTLMFVALHELAHIMTISINHTDEFWNNFRFILKNAIDLGVYKYVDYSNNPQKYCGIVITDSPLDK